MKTFTLEQIKNAHSKVKSGADFPAYIQQLRQLGVVKYETYVHDGHTLFDGEDGYSIQSDAKYDPLNVSDVTDKIKFEKDLKDHQQGKSSFLTFCEYSAASGVEKWIVDMQRMTCTYYNKSGSEVLMESIPAPK